MATYRLYLLFLQKEKVTEILIGISENSNSFGGNIDILQNCFLLIHEHGLPIYLSVASISFKSVS